MRAVIQRVSRARVTVEEEEVGAVGRGLCVLLGAGVGDDETDVVYMADKIAHLRVFADDEGKMNLSVLDTRAEVLLVSQFTLYGDVRKGRRPSFLEALNPEAANALFENVVARLRTLGIASVQTGRFRTHMMVDIVNDGPVTIILDSRKQF